MSGFRTEKQLWKWMRPRMAGEWKRVEAIVPEGMFDLIGRANNTLHFVELKVGFPSMKAVESSQKSFAKFLEGLPVRAWYVWGGLGEKDVLFFDAWTRHCIYPAFWRGPKLPGSKGTLCP